MKHAEQTASIPSTTGARVLPGRDWLALTKPGIVLGNVLMTAVGLALGPVVGWPVVLATLVGTGLLIASCGALNMVLEADTDARMKRTSGRPVAAGRVTVWGAALFGVALFTAGMILLTGFVNHTAALFGALACIVYTGFYTPLKRFSPVAVPVGAVAGALPPVIGWYATGAGGTLVPALLFGVLFVWQLPHFLGIAMRRWEDYEEAGLRIAPRPENFPRTIRSIRVWTAVLVLVTAVTLSVVGAGLPLWGLTIAALLPMVSAAVRSVESSEQWAKRVFFSSLGFLPAFALGAFLTTVV